MDWAKLELRLIKEQPQEGLDSLVQLLYRPPISGHLIGPLGNLLGFKLGLP